jgi:hypothetical protein
MEWVHGLDGPGWHGGRPYSAGGAARYDGSREEHPHLVPTWRGGGHAGRARRVVTKRNLGEKKYRVRWDMSRLTGVVVPRIERVITTYADSRARGHV